MMWLWVISAFIYLSFGALTCAVMMLLDDVSGLKETLFESVGLRVYCLLFWWLIVVFFLRIFLTQGTCFEWRKKRK
ncbi:MAG: hypothetical protein Ta2A_12140 [Treponemataceae bacterium]|nr:MAG: hypothetical protein Ta2A_12140 [Treponemataceae bacterium]